MTPWQELTTRVYLMPDGELCDVVTESDSLSKRRDEATRALDALRKASDVVHGRVPRRY